MALDTVSLPAYAFLTHEREFMFKHAMLIVNISVIPFDVIIRKHINTKISETHNAGKLKAATENALNTLTLISV